MWVKYCLGYGLVLTISLSGCNYPGGTTLIPRQPVSETLPVPQIGSSVTVPIIRPVSSEIAQTPVRDTLVVSPTRLPSQTAIARSFRIDDFLAACPTEREIASVNAKITFNFESDPSEGMLKCKAADGSADLTRLQLRAIQAVMVMKYLKFKQPLPWTDQTLYDWFTSTVRGIRFRNDIPYSFCCEPDRVINIITKLTALDTDFWVGPNREGNMGLMVLYVHEARHIETGGHPCGDKDNTINELGSFGVQYYLYRWLAYDLVNAGFLEPSSGDRQFYRQVALEDANMLLGVIGDSQVQGGAFCQETLPTPGSSPTVP